jgi:hypothetical protein
MYTGATVLEKPDTSIFKAERWEAAKMSVSMYQTE